MLSVIRVKGGGGEGSPVPGRQDSAVGGRQGRGETEGGGSGDGSLTPERRLGLSPALMTGCPQHRARLEAGKDGVKQMSAVQRRSERKNRGGGKREDAQIFLGPGGLAGDSWLRHKLFWGTGWGGPPLPSAGLHFGVRLLQTRRERVPHHSPGGCHGARAVI